MKYLGFIAALVVLVLISQGCSPDEPSRDQPVTMPTATPVIITMEQAEVQASGNEPPICFIGVDALTWDILQPMLDVGELPNMSRLIENGSRGPFDTADDRLFSPRIWTSMATGKMPEKHGIEFFLINPTQAKNSGKTAGSDLRTCLAIWNILSRFQKRVLVSNYMVTWPAESVHGTILSDFFYMDRGTYPPDIQKELQDQYMKREPRQLHCDRIYQRFFPWYTGDRETTGLTKSHDIRISNLRDCIRRDEITLNAALEQVGEQVPDLSMLYLRSVDIASHFFWKYSQLPRKDSRLDGLEVDLERYENVIPEIYRWTDEQVGRIMNVYPEETQFILVSDHGFETLFNDLRGYNLLTLMRDRGLGYYEDKGQMIPAITDTADPIDMVRRIFLLEDRIEDYTAATGESGRQLLERIALELSALKTRSGKHLLTRMPLDQIKMQNNEDPPDLAFRFSAELSPEDMIAGDDRDVSIEKYIQFLEMSGNHNKRAVMIASGPGIRRQTEIEHATTLDVTPTLLNMLNLPVGLDMDGKPLQEIFTAEFRDSHPVTWIDTYEGKIERHVEEAPESQRPRVLEELKAIGYIQ
jgi:predicted AlkP superfamily phosphohydrolase/phosphomutase